MTEHPKKGQLSVRAAVEAWREYWDRDEGGTDEEAMAFALGAASSSRAAGGFSGIPVPMSVEVAEDNDSSNSDVTTLLAQVSHPQRGSEK